jgi:NADPH-dependent glutamate synthase beta subunit-like oxidoreductase/Pyruvate/2-oxoacid:ferredoxin oxidoreductase delta subunit
MNTPALPPATWTTGSTEALRTGTWRAALPEYRQAPSPCHLACPVGGRIASWIQQARAGDWHGAWTTLTENNPFPAIAGRICHHPCESACNRAGYDEPLAICALERHVGDRALAEGWRHPADPLERNARIAVVGGGPSGLSAAYQLRRRGYAVTIFEAQQALGGLLRDGIPPYRLPRDVLDGEIRRVLDLGIEVRLGSALAGAEDFVRLRGMYAAVYLAIGARRQKRLAQLDYGAPWVMDSAAYLARANAGAPPSLGKRLAVIGGGSAAMDVARSARRAGHEVTVLCLESEAQMPAQREEVEQAKEEGVRFMHGALLQSAAAGAAGGLALHCQRARFEAGPARGQFRVTPIEGSGFDVAADAVVPAIGQDPELAGLAPLFAADGALVRTDAKGATSLPGVFAGGDVASGARFVTQAIGMGKAAAVQIDRWLQGQAGAAGKSASAVPASAINTAYFPRAARPAEARLAPGARLRGTAEVQAGLAVDQALEEAGRCFSCGNCVFCDNCFYYCPDMAVRRVPGGYAIAADYCKGCGLCVAECPTGSMEMREERR